MGSFHPTTMVLLSFLLATLLLRMNLSSTSATMMGNKTDQLALLSFKNQITDDPLGVLSSWNSSLHFCQWTGITCGHQHQRVTVLNIRGQKLVGSISPSISNLSFLRTLDLSSNSFNGEIPQEIGRLIRLQILNLSINSFGGEIPANVSHCTRLNLISFSQNLLKGKIPAELSQLSKLNKLDLSTNNFTGKIPPSFGNLSLLLSLSVGANSLWGSIPDELGRLRNLRILFMGGNQLSGVLPSSLYNLSSMEFLSMGPNQLHGIFPFNLGLSLPNLQRLEATENQFSGSIPVSLLNASMLTIIDLSRNSFSGLVPENLGLLQDLLWLNLGFNELGTNDTNDLNFLSSLTNCSQLEMLSLGSNLFTGALPDSVANLSIHLSQIYLGGNRIFGSVPEGIENLINLIALNMQGNFLTGTIPIGIGKLEKLEEMAWNLNRFSGEIPSSLGNLTRLYLLHLYGNNFHGGIPSSLGNCQQLAGLDLSQNQLSGSIPLEIFSIFSLEELFLYQNSLAGTLPMEVGHLSNLQRLAVFLNDLSGEIPSSLSTCLTLEYLVMDNNSFHGAIPSSFSALKGLRELSLSHNNLSGHIPAFLGELLFLEYLDLSFNDLEGVVPNGGIFKNASAVRIFGNNKLCGGIQALRLPSCPKEASISQHRSSPTRIIVISVVSALASLFLLACFLVILYLNRNLRKRPPSLFPLEDQNFIISYAELFKATDGFSSANLIGVGSYGSVYKGILDFNEVLVAVKVFNLQRQGATKSFLAECEALKNTRHRNLIKVLTCCSSIDFNGNEFKALILQYLPNGSLERYLHPDEEKYQSNLNLIQRLNIAIDVASALDYLHHQCQTPIIHCDLKPSNILLDDDMTGHVGDFGLTRILSESTNNQSRDQISSIGIKGSVGYLAPEYGMGGEVSTHGDVYSFGILLLEMFIGKRPTDDNFRDGLTIHQLAKMAFPERMMEVIDMRLLPLEDLEAADDNVRGRTHECLVSLIKIGLSCSTESPQERMNMRDVAVELHVIRDRYHGVKTSQLARSHLLEEGPSYITNY